MIVETDPRRPASIERSLHGDPETIVLKALEKNRDRRYQSAAELAADVRHYLNGAPIEARRANRLYVIRKQCRRHWPTVTSLCTVVLLLVLSLIVSTVQWRQTETQRTKAELARQAADLATHKAKILLSRMWVQLDHPVNAEKLLRAEGDRQSDEGLRFAVREFEGRYPKLFPLVALGRLQDVEYSPSGDWLAAVGPDGSLRLLDARDGSVTQTLSARTVRARCVAFGTLTSNLFIGGSDGLLRILPFSEQTGRIADSPPRELDVSLASITCLALTRDGRRLAAGGTQVSDDTAELGGAVFVCDVRTGARLLQLKISKPINDVAFSRDGGQLAAACEDGIVRIWRVSDATLLNMSREFEPALRAIEFNRDGDRLFVGAKYLSSWEPIADRYEKLEHDARWGIRSIDVSPDGRYLAAAAGDGLVRYYDTEQHRLLYTRGYHDNAVAGHINVVFAPNGTRVASVGSDGLRVWRFLPAEAAKLVDDDGTSYSAVHAEFSSVDGSVLITAQANRGASANRLFRWDQHSRPRTILRGSYTELSAPVPMRDGRVFLAGRRCDGSCVGLFVENPPGHEAERVAVEIMNLPRPSAVLVLEGNEPTVLLGFADGSIRSWSESRGRLDVIYKFDSACTRIFADVDRRWLMATSEGDEETQIGRVAWWRIHRSASTGTVELRFQEEIETDHRVWDATVIGNATETSLVATAGNTKNVSVWDAASGKRITSLVGHSDAIRQCIALDDRLVVTSSDDRTVRIWNALTGEELCKLHASMTQAPILAARGDRIAVADTDGIIVIGFQ